jgi:mono/diheme cytochrome c family protein
MRSQAPSFFWCLIRISIILIILWMPSAAAAQTGASAAPSGSATVPADAAAAAFQHKCAACHTVGGGKFGDAPDLNVVAAWPRADLLAAIKRMEKNVGPLTDDDIADLATLLQAADVRQRLAAAQQRLLSEMAATVAPGDPRLGRALFVGEARLDNGGLPCSSCHTAAQFGGSFAVDLTGVFGRLGQAGLVSAIEGANFPVMQAAYRARPVTPQEAVNLAEYFKSINSASAPPAIPSTSGPPVARIGAALALVCAAPLLFLARRRRPAGTRARLVRTATRSRHA